MNFKNLWHRLAMFFEHGDLTPVAVLISVAHYGPVLVAHGENVIVAWGVGALIDLLHFRTVRKLFQVKGSWSIAGHAGIALATTLMAAMYHLRFYAGDWLLAIPIPVGIAILAQHAASHQADDWKATIAMWRGRVRLILASAKKYKSDANNLQIAANMAHAKAERLQAETKEAIDKANALQAQTTKLQDELTRERSGRKSERERADSLQVILNGQQKIITAWESLNKEHQTLAQYNANIITVEQAAELIGVKDTRTVQSRAEKLNGVHK